MAQQVPKILFLFFFILFFSALGFFMIQYLIVNASNEINLLRRNTLS